ncbi:hypothetical protein J7E63_12910 [Bacillus sp. ISL-75]|uniref:hypothetical protein n=1 Tax=Bacillus sp. ISL-75 TaxID=2819137 RepID=UPI001BE88D3D|nr:hypothetical protein [Bacillus sp. ISL-75]MBT2727839.1 hypothetical protein [Bacillus sp. ISL-75]
MYKFKALVQFSYNGIMYNPRRETYQLNDDVVSAWAKERLVKIVEEKPKKSNGTKKE